MGPSFNVVLFGEAGVGKSSVINLIAGEQVVKTSPGNWGCTLESKKCTFQVAGRPFKIWETIGMGEPFISAADYLGAIENMYTLIQQITTEGGLDLLLFCIPGIGSRLNTTMLYNYRLYFDVLCEKRIPIALVATHLEDEASTEEWWDRNGEYMSQRGLKFDGHACVTGLVKHPKAAEGQSTLESLLLGYNDRGRHPMPPILDWFSGFLGRLSVIPRSTKLKDKQKELERLLYSRCAMNQDNARRLAGDLVRPIPSPSLPAGGYPSESHTEMRSFFNIVIFGEAGAGKSSVINLIAGEEVAETSPDSKGCTFQSRQYTFQVARKTFNIWDTIGLGEPIISATDFLGAIEKTYTLIQQIKAKGGLHLLLFCITGVRITDTTQWNYKLFFEVLCEKRVPISVVITRLENEEGLMDDWWTRNMDHVSQCGLKFSGHACITGLPNHPKKDEGRFALEQLLLGYNDRGCYPMPSVNDWFSGFLERLPIIPRSKSVKNKRKEVETLLRNRYMMDKDTARRHAQNLTRPREQDE